MARKVFLYAFDNLFQIVDCKFLEGDAISVRNMFRLADWMSCGNTTLKVYAVDSRPKLYSEYRETIKTSDFVKQLEFADMIQREGIRIR